MLYTMNVSDDLISWYMDHKRSLPWRETRDPYRIWLSEIILQQTRVEQGMMYYLRFVNTYPNIGFLARAKEEDVMKNWQGLGYYSRARNLFATAKYIYHDLGGEFPRSYDNLLKLKGVGPYTAAAIASFAYKLPHAVVDGNVARVLSRLFDLELPINSAEGKKLLDSLAAELLHPEHPDLHNQAIMELGALVCTPQSPGCGKCPVRMHCMAQQRGTVTMRPQKVKKSKAKAWSIHYMVLESEEGVIFRFRKKGGVWKGLFDFISLEDVSEPSAEMMLETVKGVLPQVEIKSAPRQVYATRHLLTHRKIEAEFWHISVTSVNGGALSGDCRFVPFEDIKALPVSRLVHKYLEKTPWLE